MEQPDNKILNLTTIYQSRYTLLRRIYLLHVDERATFMRLPKAIIVFSFFVISLSAMGCLGRAPVYHKKSWPGQIKKGTTQEEVKKQLGEPMGFHRRQISSDDLREIWVYHFRDRNPAGKHLYPKTHMIVFNNGKVVTQDPSNPYASQYSVK